MTELEYIEKQVAKMTAKMKAAMREAERTANILRSTQRQLESAERWGQEVAKDRARIIERCNFLWGKLPEEVRSELAKDATQPSPQGAES